MYKCKAFWCLTFGLGQKTLAVAPLQLKDVEADEILQVHQHHHQGVQLISEPEVCKLHPVERRREDAELKTNGAERHRLFLLFKKRKKCLMHFRKDWLTLAGSHLAFTQHQLINI